ncbi:uncharacterized protein [Malus domestica]|uniref:uncharacterized protein isoform X2 n=1 Tax=Malus domestica TaxID=3750 RepID=UPI0039759892
MLDFVRLDFLPLRFVGVFSILLDLWHGVSPYHHQWKIRVCGGDFRRISSWIAEIILIRRGGTGNWSGDLARFSTGDKDLDDSRRKLITEVNVNMLLPISPFLYILNDLIRVLGFFI